MNTAKRPRIGIPLKHIPKGYLGEKFGVLLVFLKGDTDEEIEGKAQRIRKYCADMQVSKETDAI